MARTKGSVGAQTEQAIRQAALDLIFEHGFEAMTLRMLAARVGLQPGSIYRYIDGKEELLARIMVEHMEDLLAALEANQRPDDGPAEALSRFVDFHIRYHINRRKQVFVSNMELRALTPEPRQQVTAMRRRYEDCLRAILRRGHQSGDFLPLDSDVSTFAIISMLTGVCFWWSVDGRLDLDETIRVHRDLVLNGVLGRPSS